MARTLTIASIAGQTYYAFPSNQSFADWSTHRVAFAAGSSPNASRYTASVDETASTVWFAFAGSSQPAEWGDAIGEWDLSVATEANATANRDSVIDAIGDIDIPAQTVVVLPGIAHIPERQIGRVLTVFAGETAALSVTVLDAARQPIDMTGWTLQFKWGKRRGDPVATVSATGTSTGFTATLSGVPVADDLSWTLWRSGAVITQGTLIGKWTP
jgi:hypothetical protein